MDSEVKNMFLHEIRPHESKKVLWLSFLKFYLKNKFRFTKNQFTVKSDTNCKEVDKRSKMFFKTKFNLV